MVRAKLREDSEKEKFVLVDSRGDSKREVREGIFMIQGALQPSLASQGYEVGGSR